MKAEESACTYVLSCNDQNQDKHGIYGISHRIPFLLLKIS